jgi:hypothetical protein
MASPSVKKTEKRIFNYKKVKYKIKNLLPLMASLQLISTIPQARLLAFVPILAG